MMNQVRMTGYPGLFVDKIPGTNAWNKSHYLGIKRVEIVYYQPTALFTRNMKVLVKVIVQCFIRNGNMYFEEWA